MNDREDIIRLWFEMWLKKKDLGISNIFDEKIIYIESWGPCYKNIEKLKLWFNEWNTRGAVLKWEIKQFVHKENQTFVEWSFECKIGEELSTFDGVSLVKFNLTNKIIYLKEYGCNINNYDPYEKGDIPEFKDEKVLWN